MKDVRNVVPIKDASDRTLMYAVNYDDVILLVTVKIYTLIRIGL